MEANRQNAFLCAIGLLNASRHHIQLGILSNRSMIRLVR